MSTRIGNMMHATAVMRDGTQDRSLIDRVIAAIGSAAGAIVEARRRQAAIATLNSFDDRMLKDIGIDRSEIVSAVDGRDADRVRYIG